jgi:predicted nucleic acid-binding Zn ribbon protein
VSSDDRPPEVPDLEVPDPEEQHREDGLDLAKAITRATAKSTPTARTRQRKKDQRPARGRVSGAHPDDRDPQLLDSTLSRLVDDHGWELDLKVHGVFGRWAELVGAEVAQHCTPESFADGRLVVRTDSTAWATQLRLLAPNVVRRLNEELGHGTVALIEVLGPHLPSWKKGPRSVRDGRGPRDTYG